MLTRFSHVMMYVSDLERAPIYAHIEPTTACNLRCGSCPRIEFVKKSGDGKVSRRLRISSKGIPVRERVI